MWGWPWAQQVVCFSMSTTAGFPEQIHAEDSTPEETALNTVWWSISHTVKDQDLECGHPFFYIYIVRRFYWLYLFILKNINKCIALVVCIYVI